MSSRKQKEEKVIDKSFLTILKILKSTAQRQRGAQNLIQRVRPSLGDLLGLFQNSNTSPKGCLSRPCVLKPPHH